jgi:hypothetical protein
MVADAGAVRNWSDGGFCQADRRTGKMRPELAIDHAGEIWMVKWLRRMS